MPYTFSFTAAKCTSIIIKMSGSESRQQEEAACIHVFRPTYIRKGSTTILNYVNGSRNHLNVLLESRNQVEILESGIMISMFILGYLINIFLYIMNHMMHDEPLLGKQESLESI